MSGKEIRFSYFAGGSKAEETVRNGVEAEKLGFDYVWVGDHITDIPPPSHILDAWTVLAYIGCLTRKIRLGPGVTDAQRIHPAKTANIVSTLDNLTNGRVVLGIGAGEMMNIKPYGILWEPAAARVKRLREALEAMKLLWSSSYRTPVNFSGEFYRLHEAHLALTPLQKPHPPIFIGAFTSTRMLSLIGKIADGWYPHLNTLDSFRRKTGVIKEAVEKAGRDIREIDVIVNVPTVVSSDPSVRKQVKKEFKKLLISFRGVLKALGTEEIVGKLPKNLEYQLLTPTLDCGMALEKAVEQLPVPDEVLEKGIDEMMAVGSADECINSLDRFVKAGATIIHPTPPIAKRENYRLIAQKVIPYFTPV